MSVSIRKPHQCAIGTGLVEYALVLGFVFLVFAFFAPSIEPLNDTFCQALRQVDPNINCANKPLASAVAAMINGLNVLTLTSTNNPHTIRVEAGNARFLNIEFNLSNLDSQCLQGDIEFTAELLGSSDGLTITPIGEQAKFVPTSNSQWTFPWHYDAKTPGNYDIQINGEARCGAGFATSATLEMKIIVTKYGLTIEQLGILTLVAMGLAGIGIKTIGLPILQRIRPGHSGTSLVEKVNKVNPHGGRRN